MPGSSPASDLARLVDPADVLEGDAAAGAVVDWTGRFRGTTPALVRPRSTDQVAAVLAWCAERGVAVVPQGGNTGLVGGSVPLEGEVVLSLVGLAEVGAVDPLARQVTVGAGATLASLDAAAGRRGLRYGVDLGARDSATVGGTIATNAGGVHVLRHGMTRAQVRGIEAVRSDGSVVSHLGGLVKDNTGYDLAGLLCGSEGTLAVVTAARVRLLPRRRERVVAALGFDSSTDAVEAVAALAHLDTLVAAEIVWRAGVELVLGLGAQAPFGRDTDVLVLVECEGDVDPTPSLADALAGVRGLSETAVATDPAGRARLWELRERQTEAIATVGIPHKLDVTLPLDRLAAFVDEVPGIVSAHAPGARTWLFGHAADGNIHVNVTGVDADDEAVDDAVLRAVADRGGSISAEHGIGRAKRRWMHLARSPEELALFGAIRAAWDPAGILNPGVLAPPAPPAPPSRPPGPRAPGAASPGGRS